MGDSRNHGLLNPYVYVGVSMNWGSCFGLLLPGILLFGSTLRAPHFWTHSHVPFRAPSKVPNSPQTLVHRAFLYNSARFAVRPLVCNWAGKKKKSENNEQKTTPANNKTQNNKRQDNKNKPTNHKQKPKQQNTNRQTHTHTQTHRHTDTDTHTHKTQKKKLVHKAGQVAVVSDSSTGVGRGRRPAPTPGVWPPSRR